jgi:inosose dehydratase
MTTRRDFLRTLGGGAAAAALLPLPNVRPMQVEAPDGIKYGYAAITWGGNDEQAIDEISAVGYPGIQLRSGVLSRFGDRPRELRELLARHRLTFVALSSGNVSIDPALESRMIDEHVSHAKFLRDAGGLYLQLIDERPKGRDVTAADHQRLARVMSEIGKRTADLGIQVAYHPHMGSMGEKPADIERILAASDPRYVRLLLDVAHYREGGGDPAAAIRQYADRLLFLHIKDLRRGSAGAPFQFVELGRGSVDLPGVFAALRDVRFNGWAVVELDAVPDTGGSPKASAEISKRYLEDVIGARLSERQPPARLH